MAIYLLDANVLIEAKNRYYGFDFCPGFWDFLQRKNANNYICSIDKVKAELIAGSDELAGWAKKQNIQFYDTDDIKIIAEFAKIDTWIESQEYKQVAVTTFPDGADYYLIAYALANNAVIVTEEVPNVKRIKKIKIPDVCIGLNIKCINTFDFLRQLNAKFILS